MNADPTPLPTPRVITGEITHVYGSNMRTRAPSGQTPAVAQDIAVLHAELSDHRRDLAHCQAELDAERDAHAVTALERAAALRMYELELAERNRIATLHAEVSAQVAWVQSQFRLLSAENLELRRRLYADETTVVDVPLPGGAR